MSHRRSVALAAATLFLLPAASASAGTAAIPSQCKVPLIGLQSGQLNVEGGTAAVVQRSVGGLLFLTANFVTPNRRAFDAPTSIDGTMDVALSFVPRDGGESVPVTAKLTVAKTSWFGTNVATLEYAGTGKVAYMLPRSAVKYDIRVDGFGYNLTAYDGGWGSGPQRIPVLSTDIDGNPAADSDGDPYTFDVSCKLTPDGAPTTLGTVEATDGIPLATPTPPPTPTTPVTPTPTPNGEEPSAQFSYSLQGSTTLNTLTKGTMPLTGSVDASLTLSTGDFTADLKLNPTQGRLTALGFLPVTATVGFVTSGPTTGKLVDDQLSTNSKVRIKVTSVKAFGAIPLAGGNDCQTKQLSDISLKSTDSFDPTNRGGTIGGTYAISDLNGCGPLNGLVSPITAGKGNTISLKLTPVQ